MNANMQVYALFNVSNPDRVSAALRAKFPDDHKLLGNNEWLISSAAATSREVCDSLGISDGSKRFWDHCRDERILGQSN